VAIKKNGENDITGISLVKSGANSEDDSSIHILSGSLDTDTKEIVLTVPWNTDLSAVTAVLALSTDAKLPAGSPGDDGLWSVENLDLTRTQYFTVEAQDGSKQTWTVKAEYDTSYIIALDVELAGAYKVKFGFSYPNHKEIGGEPDYTGYDYDIAYKNGGSLDTANPIRLSYFVTDNAIYEGSARKTYYNTLVVSAPGFTDVEWRIDGRAAPGNNSTPGGPLSYVYVGQNNGDWSYVTGSGYINTPGTGEFDRVPSFNSPNSNILTIRAQDWFLESTHTVVFIGKRDNILYSGTFEFKVVEQEPKKEAGE
jgi:hypothetical protein